MHVAELLLAWLGHNEADKSLRNVLESLLAELPRHLVCEIDIFLVELCRITVLWEEQWGSALQEIQHDLMRKCVMLQEDAIRTMESDTITEAQKLK